jgi:hypothetical protein
MSDDIEWLACRDVRGELGPMLDRAIARIVPDEHVMWDISYAIIPVQGGSQVKGMVVLTIPSPNLGEGLIAGTICDHRRMIMDADLVERIVARLVDELHGQVRAQIQAGLDLLRRPPDQR